MQSVSKVMKEIEAHKQRADYFQEVFRMQEINHQRKMEAAEQKLEEKDELNEKLEEENQKLEAEIEKLKKDLEKEKSKRSMRDRKDDEWEVLS
ncbi:unnamed protein product [Caenorhabditis brenneri]